ARRLAGIEASLGRLKPVSAEPQYLGHAFLVKTLVSNRKRPCVGANHVGLHWQQLSKLDVTGSRYPEEIAAHHVVALTTAKPAQQQLRPCIAYLVGLCVHIMMHQEG